MQMCKLQDYLNYVKKSIIYTFILNSLKNIFNNCFMLIFFLSFGELLGLLSLLMHVYMNNILIHTDSMDLSYIQINFELLIIWK